MKEDGLENDLIQRIKSDEFFAPIIPELDSLLDAKSFIGRAPEQVDAFLEEWVKPALAPWRHALESVQKAELSV